MHTNGPWRVMDLGDGYRIVAEAEDKQIIASIYFRDDDTPANALLIAAAPEQNAALIDLVALVRRIVPDADMLHEIHNADKAIRTAKGD